MKFPTMTRLAPLSILALTIGCGGSDEDSATESTETEQATANSSTVDSLVEMADCLSNVGAAFSGSTWRKVPSRRQIKKCGKIGAGQKKAAESSDVGEVNISTSLLKTYQERVNPPQPALKVVNHGTLTVCYTKSQQKMSRDDSKLCSRLKSETSKSAKDNASSEKSYEKFKSNHYRIDYDWRDRKGMLRKDRYGCWNESLRYWEDKKQPDCPNNWVLRSYSYGKNSKGFLYSGQSFPKKPHLMDLIDKKEVKFPERFFCDVTEAEPKSVMKTKGELLTCKLSDGIQTYLKLKDGIRLDVNIGDVVSVPLASAPKSGLLLEGVEKNGSIKWTVYAESSDLKIEKSNGSCPSEESLNPHRCRYADSKSNPKDTYDACLQSKDMYKINKLAKSWDKNKKIEDKNLFMIDVLNRIISDDAQNIWAHLSLAQNQMENGQVNPAVSTVKKIIAKSDDAKELMKAASLAEKLESFDTQLSAFEKACELGNKSACKKLPVEGEEE